MRKGLLVMLMFVLAPGCLCLTGCGGAKEKDEGGPVSRPLTMARTESQTGTKEKTSPASGEQTPAGTVVRTDIPVYPGAGGVGGGHGSEEGAISGAERRVYLSGDAVEQVAAFYKAEMVVQGWEEMMFVEQEDLCMATWQKKEADEKVSIKILTDSKGGSTIIITKVQGNH